MGAIQTLILLALRHETFFSLEAMNAAIRRELDRLNEAPMACGESRRAIFEVDERAHLQPLPANPWEWGEWLDRKVGQNCHVRVERNYYSVPEGYKGRSVDARLGERMVEVFLEKGGERIAVHRRRNLLLLDGTSNIEKQAMLPAEWIEAKYPDEEGRGHYREKSLLDRVPDGMAGFLEFYEARRARLQDRISELVNSV